MRALPATLALLALLFAVPPAQAEETGPFDEECEEAVQVGCAVCGDTPACRQECYVYREAATGFGWSPGVLFSAGLCIFLDCVPATPCPPTAGLVKVLPP